MSYEGVVLFGIVYFVSMFYDVMDITPISDKGQRGDNSGIRM